MKLVSASLVLLYKYAFPDKSLHSVEIWMQKRHSEDELSGLWEFPGGKIGSNESPEMAAVREIHEECDLVIEAKNLIFLNTRVSHLINKQVTLYCFAYQATNLIIKRQGQWFPLFDPALSLEKKNLPPINYKILADFHHFIATNSL